MHDSFSHLDVAFSLPLREGWEGSFKTLLFKKPARTSRGSYTEHRMLLVKVTDEKGNVGVGECAPLPDLSCDRHCYDDIEAVRKLLGNKSLEELRNYPALLFALETAIAACQKDTTLYDTPFARGEVGIPFNGLVWMDSYENMLRQVEEKIAAGFKCVKLKIGAIEFEKELEIIRIIRSHYSQRDIELRVDANGAFNSNNAMQHLEALARYDLHSIEQPIRESWDAMAKLCRETPLPIALDEELIGVNRPEEKERLLDTIMPHYIVLKPTMHGGISGTREWIRMSRQRGINSWITSALESNIGLHTIALLAASEYGPQVSFPQGLGTGQLFVENIPMPIESCGAEIRVKSELY